MISYDFKCSVFSVTLQYVHSGPESGCLYKMSTFYSDLFQGYTSPFVAQTIHPRNSLTQSTQKYGDYINVYYKMKYTQLKIKIKTNDNIKANYSFQNLILRGHK